MKIGLTREQWFNLNDILHGYLRRKKPIPEDLHRIMKRGLEPLNDKAAEENRSREAQSIIDRESYAR